MVQDFDDIMSNYQDMSVEELGTSLLKRQAQQRAEVAKTSKRNQRIQQALGVLLAGQSIFKNQFNKRVEELENEKTLDLLNIENDTKKINAITDVVSIIPENFEVDKPLEERVNSFINNSELYNQLKIKSQRYIDSYISPLIKENQYFKDTPEYDNLIRHGNKALLSSLLENNNYQTFVKELSEMEGGILPKDELFAKYLRINPSEMTQQRTREYQKLEKNLSKQAGFIEGIKGVVQKISKDKANKGELNLYEKITSEDIKGSDLKDILNKLDIGGVLIPELDKALAAASTSSTKYRNEMTTPKGEKLFTALVNGDFPSLVNNIRRGRFTEDKLMNTTGLLNEVDIFKLKDVFDYIDDNDNVKKELLKDAGALSLRFQDDPQFAVDIYKTLTNDINKINRFKNKIQDTEFRNKYSILLAAKMGIKGAGTFLNMSVSDLVRGEFDKLGHKRYEGYDRNAATLLLEDVFEINNKRQFKPTTEYYFLDEDQQKMVAEKKIIEILNSSMSLNDKQKTIDNFFDNIDVPGFTNQEDFIKELNKKYGR